MTPETEQAIDGAAQRPSTTFAGALMQAAIKNDMDMDQVARRIGVKTKDVRAVHYRGIAPPPWVARRWAKALRADPEMFARLAQEARQAR